MIVEFKNVQINGEDRSNCYINTDHIVVVYSYGVGTMIETETKRILVDEEVQWVILRIYKK
jgi:protein involved in ribonucleotide reduction